jgi:hypothetical protein
MTNLVAQSLKDRAIDHSYNQQVLYSAYRATLLYVCLVTHTVVREKRKNLVEVFARVRVNLRILKGKIAGKRACWRTKGDCSGPIHCQSTCVK